MKKKLQSKGKVSDAGAQGSKNSPAGARTKLYWKKIKNKEKLYEKLGKKRYGWKIK